jgi:hypothetical protein
VMSTLNAPQWSPTAASMRPTVDAALMKLTQ